MLSFLTISFSNSNECLIFRSCYKVLIPQLVVRDKFEEVKSIANQLERDWKQLLAHCFPKILVNILPYFACQSYEDSDIAQKRGTAYKVYDTLQDEAYLGKQVSFKICFVSIQIICIIRLNEKRLNVTIARLT